MSDTTNIIIKLYEPSDKIVAIKENVLKILPEWMFSSLTIFSNHTDIRLETWNRKWPEELDKYDRELFKDFCRSIFVYSSNCLCDGWIENLKNSDTIKFSGNYNISEDNKNYIFEKICLVIFPIIIEEEKIIFSHQDKQIEEVENIGKIKNTKLKTKISPEFIGSKKMTEKDEW